jgi:hypothetical protein
LSGLNLLGQLQRVTKLDAEASTVLPGIRIAKLFNFKILHSTM